VKKPAAERIPSGAVKEGPNNQISNPFSERVTAPRFLIVFQAGNSGSMGQLAVNGSQCRRGGQKQDDKSDALDSKIVSLQYMFIMRFLIIWLLVAVTWSCSNSQLNKKNDGLVVETYQKSLPSFAGRGTSILKERSILKKYAFCRCLISRYPQDSFLRKDGALTGYEEIGSYGNGAYEAVDSFVIKWCQAKYSSKYRRNLYMMQCIDL